MRAKFVLCSLCLVVLTTIGCSGAPETAQVAKPQETSAAAPKAGEAVDASNAPSLEPAETLGPSNVASSSEMGSEAIEYFPPASEFSLNADADELATSEPVPDPEPLKSFRPEDGSFEVLFPTEPETSTESLQDGGNLAIYRSAADGMERQVNAFDLPEAMTREDAEATLRSVVDSIVEAAGGEALEQEIAAGLDYPAIRYDYAYEVEGERFRTAGILAVVDSRQFQASVLSTEQAWDDVASTEFLDSFRPSYQTPALTAPQFGGPKVSDATQPMQVRAASAPLVDAPAPVAPTDPSPPVEEAAPAGVERRLPWVDATVAFPAEPESLSDEATAETDRMLHAFAGSQSFSVTMHREEEDLPIEISREILAATAEAIASSVSGEAIVSEPVANEAFADHRLSYRYAGDGSGPVQVRQRLLFVDAVQIYLIVAGPVEGFDEAAAQRFLDSWSPVDSDAVAEGAASDSAQPR